MGIIAIAADGLDIEALQKRDFDLPDSVDDDMSQAVRVSFVDVAQGDCTIVAIPDVGGILIDCPQGRAPDAISAIHNLGITHLRLAFVTHWDADHFGGVLAVASAVGCEEIRYNHDSLIADTDTPKQLRLAMLLRLSSKEFDHVALSAAEQGHEGVAGPVFWEVLSPDHRTLTEAVGRRNRNRGSVILRLTYCDIRIIVAGDADAVAWGRAIGRGSVAADILRAPHHGAMAEVPNYPGIGEVIAAVNPNFVVISVGSGNTYGHPGQGVIELASATDCRVMCTEATQKCGLSESANGRTPCAGNVVFELTNEGVKSIEPESAAHRARMAALGLSPLCMRVDSPSNEHT